MTGTCQIRLKHKKIEDVRLTNPDVIIQLGVLDDESTIWHLARTHIEIGN